MKPSLRQLQRTGSGYYRLLGLLLLVIALALGAVWNMEHHGHIVTGMDNQTVWGLPHVFAVFLIVAASGALNVASMASVFGKVEFKSLAPLSGLLAVALLVGGLSVLLLDLGRPDRLIVALTHFNPRSIFSWNMVLYSGFVALVLVYLWTQMENGMERYTPMAGMAAFLWRLALTTGTGSIFGFLVARQAYDSALLGPLFVALSLSYGLAVFALVLLAACRADGRCVDEAVVSRLARLQAIFIAAGLYFVVVQHLTSSYFSKHLDYERFILAQGGVHTLVFWLGQVLLGSVVPLVLLLRPGVAKRRAQLVFSCLLVVLGGFAQMWVTIVGGQAFPLVMFPGYEASSSFNDGVVSHYLPTLGELLLGMGGVAISAVVLMLALKLLDFLPESCK